MDPLALLWGIVLTAIGVAYLGINAGWWSPLIWQDLLRFWPVLLILMGIRLLIRSRLAYFFLALGVIALVVWLVMLDNVARSQTSTTIWDFKTSNPITEERTSFNQSTTADPSGTVLLDLKRLYTITVATSDEPEVNVALTGPKVILDNLTLVRDGSTVRLEDKTRTGFFSLRALESVKGQVTIPKNVKLDLRTSGVTTLDVTDHAGRVNVDSSGASKIRFTRSTSVDPTIDMSGAGLVSFDQCSGNGQIDISGAGSISAERCTFDQLTIDSSGSSKVDIKAGTIKDLDLESSGASLIRLPKPTGQNNLKNSGASNIRYYE